MGEKPEDVARKQAQEVRDEEHRHLKATQDQKAKDRIGARFRRKLSGKGKGKGKVKGNSKRKGFGKGSGNGHGLTHGKGKGFSKGGGSNRLAAGSVGFKRRLEEGHQDFQQKRAEISRGEGGGFSTTITLGGGGSSRRRSE